MRFFFQTDSTSSHAGTRWCRIPPSSFNTIIRCCPRFKYSIFISRLPYKRCLIISPSQKIFQFGSKLFNKSLGTFLSLVQAVLRWAVGRTRSGPRDSLENLEKNQNVFYDWVTFRHLFRGRCKIKSKN